MSSLEQIKDRMRRKPSVSVSVSGSGSRPVQRIQMSVPIRYMSGVDDATKERISSVAVSRDVVMKRLRDQGALRVRYRSTSATDTAAVADDHPKRTKTKASKKVTLEQVSRLEDDPDAVDSVIQKQERRTPQPVKGVSEIPPEEWVTINGKSLVDKLPPPSVRTPMRASAHYMNNREKFVNFINSHFSEYRDELLNENIKLSCDDMGKGDSTEFKLLIHQKIVRDYLNLYTPYRGLLLYHGLGSGKTCSSIAIAEGMKSAKKIIVMTPASLRRNYIEEIKKCGDTIFKREQHWEWVSLKSRADALDTLSSAMGLTTAYIKNKKGVWLVDRAKPSNHDALSAKEMMSLDNQLDEMIQTKYEFINYNGLRRKKLRAMTNDYENNIFDHSVVVIDEVHNFISRIANKLKKEKEVTHDRDGDIEKYPVALSLVLYEMLMSAKDMRIVFLTGTPIINYPNELGILYNLLRGYIKTWNFHIKTSTGYASTNDKIKQIFSTDKNTDDFEFTKNNVLTVTRNPFGFETKTEKGVYRGVTNVKTGKQGHDDAVPDPPMDELGQISDADFKRRIIHLLDTNGIQVDRHKTDVVLFKALPDRLDTFNEAFLGENNTVKNPDLFKKRILGLTSYFRSAQEELLPKYNSATDYVVAKIPMSDYQLGLYESVRSAERKQEKNSPSAPKLDADGLFEDPKSSYRIFSRLYCNFVMPLPPGRPLPMDNQLETSFANTTKEENKKGSNDLDENDTTEVEGDELMDTVADNTYQTRITNALKHLKENGADVFSRTGLATYSPKFLHMLENISDPEHEGLHLVYSQFRTLEGIGLFKLMLDHNGYTQFKVKKGLDGVWDLAIAEEDRGKPTYALYTGTESAEEKELIRNIYNSDWDPTMAITKTLAEIANNNHMGEIIKILMITASGSEGINLRSTRFVHIMEPYWHPTRKDQVIGRARRICSHKTLPESMQNIRVFVYLMTLTDEQLNTLVTRDMKMRDKSKLRYRVNADSDLKEYRVMTSDEALFEISTMKEGIITGFTQLIKEASIDCATYSRLGKGEQLECVQYGEPRSHDMAYVPNITRQPADNTRQRNQTHTNWIGAPYMFRGKTYISRKMSDTVLNIYDEESYYQAADNGPGKPYVEPRLMFVEEKKNGTYIVRGVE